MPQHGDETGTDLFKSSQVGMMLHNEHVQQKDKELQLLTRAIRVHVLMCLRWCQSTCSHILHEIPRRGPESVLCLLQKSGINAKNDNVKVLGIRVREIMHERRIELLESAAVQPGGLLLGLISTSSQSPLQRGALRKYLSVSCAVHDARILRVCHQEIMTRAPVILLTAMGHDDGTGSLS